MEEGREKGEGELVPMIWALGKRISDSQVGE